MEKRGTCMEIICIFSLPVSRYMYYYNLFTCIVNRHVNTNLNNTVICFLLRNNVKFVVTDK